MENATEKAAPHTGNTSNGLKVHSSPPRPLNAADTATAALDGFAEYLAKTAAKLAVTGGHRAHGDSEVSTAS